MTFIFYSMSLERHGNSEGIRAFYIYLIFGIKLNLPKT